MKMKIIKKISVIGIWLFLALMNKQAVGQVWSLNQCLDTAQLNNKQLAISRTSITISEQKQDEVKASLIPKVAMNGEYKYYTNLPYQLMPSSIFGGPVGQFKEAQFGVPTNINANLQFSMPIFNPVLYNTISTAKIATVFSKLQYQKNEDQLFYDITNLYYNAQILKQQEKFLDANLINSNILLKNIQLLHEQLLAKNSDVSRVQLQVSQLTTAKINIISKYEQVLTMLKFSMGISLQRLIEVDPVILFQSTNNISYSNSVDIKIARTQFELLNNELTTLKYSKLPTLALYGTYGTTGFGYNVKPNDFLKFFPIGLVGVQLSYPIFNGTITNRKISQKKLDIKNSQLQISLAESQNEMQSQNAVIQKSVTLGLVESNNKQIEQAQKIYNQSVIQLKEGVANLTELLLADNALREAQNNYLTSIIDYMKADLELKKIKGNISTKK
jgi:OMF family outer membrane factor